MFPPLRLKARRTDSGDRAVLVVGEALDQHGDRRRGVALVHQGLVVDPAAVETRRRA